MTIATMPLYKIVTEKHKHLFKLTITHDGRLIGLCACGRWIDAGEIERRMNSE